jgi:hypothetical protein
MIFMIFLMTQNTKDSAILMIFGVIKNPMNFHMMLK